ncbi:hypothetical protein ACIQV1_18940 [Streptomyces rubiginosohelvolus]|uniref:hypothetical protein n=1 Tax=Streptomyces rubiginosohelvolus TaxID=67362 RepID=UPI0033AE88E0
MPTICRTPGPEEGRRGSGIAGTQAGRGHVEGGLQAAGLVVAVVDGEPSGYETGACGR